jgi:uncharacterized protein YcgI (DUF1989 family)
MGSTSTGGRKILTMIEDTSRGDHDTLMAACNSERYILLGVNIPWTPTGKLSFDPPTTKPGDYVTLGPNSTAS